MAAAAPRPAVNPASIMTLAISMVESMCSSMGIIWMGSMPGALFQLRCRCASTMPGMRVAPRPSTRCPPLVFHWYPPPERVMLRIRFPATVTSPA